MCVCVRACVCVCVRACAHVCVCVTVCVCVCVYISIHPCNGFTTSSLTLTAVLEQYNNELKAIIYGTVFTNIVNKLYI